MKILIIVIIVVAVLVILAAYVLASMIARPKTTSLEDEIKWEKDNDLWGNFDAYETEKYTVDGMDGYTLHAMLVKNATDTGKYVIISHGFTSNRYGAVKYVDVWQGLGYNCIIYDVRRHGENEKTACSLGNFESQDLAKLIEDTYTRYGSDIELGLQGESMGSSISLSVLAYNPDVKFVVADCGFTNLYELIHTGYSNMKIGWMTPLVNAVIKVIGGYSMKDTSAVDAVRSTTVPIMFIHGGNDTFIPPDNSKRLAEAAGGYTEVHIVDGAEHALSMKVLGADEYRKLVSGFLANLD